MVGLQEVEMGTGSVARAAVAEARAKGSRAAEAASVAGRAWADAILQCLQVRLFCIAVCTSCAGPQSYHGYCRARSRKKLAADVSG